jgi:hypothetical protein
MACRTVHTLQGLRRHVCLMDQAAGNHTKASAENAFKNVWEKVWACERYSG